MPVSLLIPFLSFVCGFVDSTLGMGYGATLVPILLLLGYSPFEVVPAVLVSQVVTGFASSLVHHRLGNVHFDFRHDTTSELHRRLGHLGYLPRSRDARVALLLAVCSVVGSVIASLIAIRLDERLIELYVGISVAAIGVFILARHRRPSSFHWRRIVTLASLAGFNKGLSGGGYGPLVTGGQVLAGVDGKRAVAITSFAEAMASLMSIVVYLVARANGHWGLALPLTIGALLSVPLAGLAVRRLSTRKLTVAIGTLTLVLGVSTLVHYFA